jgi:hypothetical protein
MIVNVERIADGHTAIRDAWVRYGLIAGGVGTIFLSIAIALSPSLYAAVVENVLLPEYEARFGFRGGRISLSGSEGSSVRYCILEVTPGGALDRFGLRSGDIPIDHHDGVVAFYTALREVGNGRHAELTVVSKDEPSWENRRSITLSP